jgi:hypothetical protein
VAFSSGTVGDDVQLVPVFQSVVAGAASQVPSVAWALTAPRHTLANSPALNILRPRRTPRMTAPRAIGIDGRTLAPPAAAGLD